jgi:transcriptional regulator with XRE-family HTH domain
MNKINQRFIAKTLNISSGFISEILTGKKRPSWSVAKRLAELTRSTPADWMEAPPEILRQIIKNMTENGHDIQISKPQSQ